MFRWGKMEGIIFRFQQRTYRLDTVEKSRDFAQQLKEETEESQGQEEESEDQQYHHLQEGS